MASMMLDLPAPVGPVRANRSAPAKSTSVRSRKVLKPSMTSRSGRTARPPPRPADVGVVPSWVASSSSSSNSVHQPLVVDRPLGEVRGEQVVGG